MRWVALLPLKAPRARKTRLSDALGPEDRVALTAAMLDHVVRRLRDCPCIDAIRVLSPEPVPGLSVIHDRGCGLNAEIGSAQTSIGPIPLLVVHPDLPLLQAGEIEAVLTAAQHRGHAIAPDRHGGGTNAVALADGAPIDWHFGPASFDRHRASLKPGHAVVRRRGLALDCDTPDDLAEALASGFRYPQNAALLMRGSRGGAA